MPERKQVIDWVTDRLRLKWKVLPWMKKSFTFNVRSYSIPLFSNRFLWLAGSIFVNELHFQASGTGVISLDLDTTWRISLWNLFSSCSSVFAELPWKYFMIHLLFPWSVLICVVNTPVTMMPRCVLVAWPKIFSPHSEQCFRVMQEFSCCSCWCLFLNSTHASSYRWDWKGESHSHLSEHWWIHHFGQEM